jgi:endonuclease/exonuclease/phosphatase family metal-dependent hydrolase
MIRFPPQIRFLAALVVAFLFSCQNKPQRIGMPLHFSGTIPDTLTVMSYNVENLFDMTDDGDEYPEFKPNACNWTDNTFQAKLSNIASVIAAVNPEIAVLVEVENENTVRHLCRATEVLKCRFPYFAIGDQSSGSNTRPVILSKLPILWEKNFGTVSGALRGASHERPMVEAAIYCGNDTLRVFACHWPSKKNQESRRVERAEMLVKELEAMTSQQDFVIAGDFNENFDESETFHTAGLDDTRGKTGINHVLGTMRSKPLENARYVRQSDLLQKRVQGFFDPWNTVAEDRRFSEVFEGRHETPDHILLPASLFDEKGLSFIDSSFRPFSWNGRLLKDGAPYRWQMRYSKQGRIHAGDGFSDHLPLVVRLAKGGYRQVSMDTGISDGAGSAPGKRGGFETGPDGFIACTKKIVVERDTLMPKSGLYCLSLSGETKSNCSAVRSRFTLPGECGTEKGILSFCLRGSGTFNFRCRAPGSKLWSYFVGPAFSQARAGRYTAYNFTKWRTARLPLSALPPGISEVEFEIRTKKECDMNLWVDEVKIMCRD